MHGGKTFVLKVAQFISIMNLIQISGWISPDSDYTSTFLYTLLLLFIAKEPSTYKSSIKNNKRKVAILKLELSHSRLLQGIFLYYLYICDFSVLILQHRLLNKNIIVDAQHVTMTFYSRSILFNNEIYVGESFGHRPQIINQIGIRGCG